MSKTDKHTSEEKLEGFFGAFGDSITFNSKTECGPDAAQISWRPKSINFRKSRGEQERYALNLYLRWSFSKNPFEWVFPLRIERADKECQPDFFVAEGEFKYGLEISRATTWRNERAVDALIEAGSDYCMTFSSDLYGDDRNINPKDYIHPKEGGDIGEPMLGISPEIEWARLVAHRIQEKTIKLNKNYSATYQECDLLLYSSWPVLDLRSAVDLLRAQYAKVTEPSSVLAFKRISIVCENWVIFDPLRNPQVYLSEGFPCID